MVERLDDEKQPAISEEDKENLPTVGSMKDKKLLDRKSVV